MLLLNSQAFREFSLHLCAVWCGFFFLRVLSHLDWLEALFRNMGRGEGGISPLVWFVWTCMNTTVALWCETKQPSQDHLEKVFLAQFHSNPGVAHVQREHNQPSKLKKYARNVLPGNKHWKITCQDGYYGVLPFCIAVFAQHCSTESPQSHSFIRSLRIL